MWGREAQYSAHVEKGRGWGGLLPHLGDHWVRRKEVRGHEGKRKVPILIIFGGTSLYFTEEKKVLRGDSSSGRSRKVEIPIRKGSPFKKGCITELLERFLIFGESDRVPEDSVRAGCIQGPEGVLSFDKHGQALFHWGKNWGQGAFATCGIRAPGKG